MDSKTQVVNVIRYEDFMPSSKFQKQEEFDTYEIPLPGFEIEQFKVYIYMNYKKGSIINIKGERPMDDGSKSWSRFSQEFKIPSDVYNTKNINATFGNGVLSIRLPKKKPSPSDDISEIKLLFSILLRMLKKTSQSTILRIAVAVAVGVSVGGYVAFKYLPSTHSDRSTN